MYLLLGLAFVFALRSLVGWRQGILLMIVLAALQDPLRKLTPGTPSWMALATAPVFVAMVVASMARTRRWWGDFSRFNPAVAKALLMLIVLSLPAAVISASYGDGSWMLTVIGAFSYSVIFLAVIAGFHYPRKLADVRKVLGVYCLVHGIMLSGGVFEYLGWFSNWQALGDDVLGYSWFRDMTGYRVNIISGFYRSGDVMGWHAAAVCILSMVLAMTGRGGKRRYWLLLSALAVIALLVCGRRKMVYMLPVFALALGWIYWQAGRASKIWAIVGLLALPVASVWVVGDWLGEKSSPVRYYTETSGQTLDVFQEHGFRSLVDTYNQTGFFGAGLGTATPGSHNLNVERPRTWQESTSSRILVELGVPGALAFLGIMVSLMLSLWRLARQQLRERSPQAQYVAGLVAFFMANVGSLTVSGQILADPFIASFLGFLVGLALSFARPQLATAPTVARPQVSPAPMSQADLIRNLPR
jgi:hypothetical protein